MEEKEGPRSFAVFVRQLADGDAEREASEALHELLESLRKEAEAQGAAKGILTLKFALTVDAMNQVEIAYDISTKEPTPLRPKAHLWITKGGNIVFENPRQQKLPLREVNVHGETREVAVKAQEAREV
jgi:hypothetical protein